MLLLSIYSHHFRVSKKNSKFHKAKSVFCFREALDLEPTRVPLKSDAKPRKLVHIVNISLSFSFVEREKRGSPHHYTILNAQYKNILFSM